MLLVRDGIITGCLMVGMMIMPISTTMWVLLLLPVALLTVKWTGSARFVMRAFSVVLALLAMLMLLYVGLVVLLVGGTWGVDYDPLTGSADVEAGLLNVFFGALLISLATLGVALGYRVAVYLTLAGGLRPGSPAPPAYATDYRLRSRLAYIDQAQWGNLTMYATEDPFMGAGRVARSWSIAVELDRLRQGGTPTARSGIQDRPVEIDPVELHGFVRERLADMRARVLHPRESIQNLDLGDQVVVRGVFTVADWAGNQAPHPMLDKDGLPRHRATPEEIAAIIRHPQGGVRYYQRVTISNTGQEIRDAGGVLVAPASDQEALTSAFIYLAVEGRMLYTQFVVTHLPPAAASYHVVDALPKAGRSRIAWEAVKVVRLGLLRDIVAAPWRLARSGLQAVRRSMSIPDPAEHLVYPYGARFSVRELGASATMQTYVQTLDAAKYTRMIEQRLTEAVLDFLEERQVDTGAYRLQAASVTMNTVNLAENASAGPIAVGHNAAATANQRAGGAE
ncbi:hypothetical protein [Nonomuraea soli]|uniref:Uncharacterized protein n=1 Tax=Nonomuraea soli TaxID=1032476 RepID=A0A7W0CP35_9ACTN|nr:hypothetical protein [Nonomuraea soli]MBA2894633.1 hypothetical protein [Nonomuraea soli]